MNEIEDMIATARKLVEPDTLAIGNMMLNLMIKSCNGMESPEFIRGFSHSIFNTMLGMIATDNLELIISHGALLLAAVDRLPGIDLMTGRKA